MTRDERVEKIRQAEEEIKTAGAIHRRDIMRHIRRLKKELRDYDRFRTGAISNA